jgi:hypothetical protein
MSTLIWNDRPSPEIRRSDLSMEFKALVRHLQGDFPHLREQEVLMVVKNSPMRMASMIRKMYTFDAGFDITKVDYFQLMPLDHK